MNLFKYTLRFRGEKTILELLEFYKLMINFKLLIVGYFI